MTVPAWFGWLLLALPCGAAPVCKCALLSVEDELARAEVVFSGTVLGMAEHYVAPVAAPSAPAGPDSTGALRASAGGRTGTPGRATTFAVARGWKGAAGADTVIVHDLLPCAQLFQAGGEYLVYAVREDGRLATSRCERTRPLAEVPGDVRQLDSLAAHRGS